jgi:signal transduction histidine kinase
LPDLVKNMMQDNDYEKDIEAIGKIPIVSQLLDVVCQTTKMGFSAIARVTEDRWITCSVHDDIAFGLKTGDELELKTTICNEIRQHKTPVIINHVAEDPKFKNHHTPLQYGFQSYISVPIIRKDGRFFGTLCAIDPKPHEINTPEITGIFALFADLIAYHLEAIEQVDNVELRLLEERELHKISDENQKKFTELLERKVEERTLELKENNDSLDKMNKELQAFAYISSHDLQEPLRKIQIFSSAIAEKESNNLTDSGKDYFKRIQGAADRMQTLINDLLAYSRASVDAKKFEFLDLNLVVAEVKSDLREEIEKKNAVIEAVDLCHCNIVNFQMRQLFYNLISNSLKFSALEKQPLIKISSKIIDGNIASEKFCHIKIEDNGIGFDQKYSEKIFELFQSLHPREKYDGTGIGLSIVKKIVENHNGKITATSEMGKGARFDIYLPEK